MQERERAANEEAEKRLKARLAAAKRDPATTPRVDGANVTNTPRDQDQRYSSAEGHGEESAMDVEAEAVTPTAEVFRDFNFSCARSSDAAILASLDSGTRSTLRRC